MSAVTFDHVQGQMLGGRQACDLGAGLHASWREAIGARRERDACRVHARCVDAHRRNPSRSDTIVRRFKIGTGPS